eukprot:CAMPEP_0179096324 /NCGR_PEP_ID=MMETSP0796-20121207/44277_1 /TAXON_ID=73915 /ORGANISM="Pyrodinium bahamense, Strain pbaha01" /LENGTH=467 /DNA_ID=CAMNT_0020794043 /DNA_START=100 /DNA_END=1503 /DNA_ORIENTATION=+
MTARRVDDVIDEIGWGRAQWQAVLVGGGIWAADGSELLLISSITLALSSDWHLTGAQRGLVVSLVYVGVLIGNALAGMVGDFSGRRIPILVSYFCIVAFSVLSAMTWGVWSMGACRMFVGMAFGFGQPAWNTLGLEISPSNSRVFVTGTSQVLFVFGEMYSAWLTWAEDPKLQQLNWRRLLVLGTLPSVVFGSLAYPFLMESPKYLAAKGQTAEAREVLSAIGRANGSPASIPTEFESAASPRSDKGLGRLGIVFGPALGFTTVVVCASTFTLNFLYYGSIYAFPQVLPDLELRVSPGANLFLGAVMEIPGYVVGTWLSNRTTRKLTMQIYLLATLLTTVMFLYGTGMDATLAVTEAEYSWAVHAGFLGMKTFVNVGFVVVYAYASEVYPTVARITGTATCLAAGRIGAMICPLVYEGLTDVTGTFHHFFIAIGCLTTFNAFLVYMLTIETAGKGLADTLELEPLHH